MCLADLGPVLDVDLRAGTARVDLAGVVREVSLAPLVLDGRAVAAGDWVVVHTGLAVELMDEAAAAEVVAARRDLTDDTGEDR
jgi:hydrogenase assembly chaperone HypC/HupF